MSAPKNVLVTGGTGFVGSHLAYRLLEDGHHVAVLARGSRNASARDRAMDVLVKVASSPERLHRHLPRLEILEGNIAEQNLGLDSDTIRSQAARINEVWHCAASLSFTDE